jgi:uncharacterized membrane protein YdjX (TVP38/TMEM64 family)
VKKPVNWVTALFVLVFLAILGLVARAYFSQYPALTSENLDLFIRGFGSWALAVFFLAYTLSSPIPFLAPILAATGGLLFGPVAGTLAAIFCAAITSLIPFFIARRLGRTWVEARLKGSRFNGVYQRIDSGSGFTVVLLLRLVPVMPWELQNYVSGVTRVSVPTYLAATLLGSTPLTVCLALLGSAARSPGSPQFFAAAALTAVVLLAPILFVYLRSRRTTK